jgi:membrane peptidoglycan carboxypeptidase
MKKVHGRRIAAAVVLALAISGIAAGAHGIDLYGPPDVQSVMNVDEPNDTLVYDRTGTVLLADVQLAGLSQHVDVPLAAMGKWLPAATVADEDPRFWSEPGVDVGRLGAAAWDAVRGQSGDTGTSIVLKLIRLRVGAPGVPEGVAQRVQAVGLAVRVGTTVPKARILETYLNTLPYGNRAVGVEAAAITYFQEDAGQLDLAQASLLAGLPTAPGRLDPLRNLPAAKQGQHQVLEEMVRNGSATQQQADQAFAEPLQLVGPATLDVAPDIVDEALAELTARYGPSATGRGFTVLTTIDWGLQQQAQQALTKAVSAGQFRGVTNGALAAIDPKTGQILALADVSSNGNQFRYATQNPRSPGGAFRIFTYAAAIAGGHYTMTTPISDAPITITCGASCPDYSPRNFDDRNHGTCQLRDCLGDGLNIPAISVEMGTGVANVVQTARALGAPPFTPQIAANGNVSFTTDDPQSSFGPSLTLGGYPETPLQMATGVGTLAAGGVLHRPEAILRVTTSDGATRYRAQAGAGTRAIDAGAAYVVSQMLSDDQSRAAIYGLSGPLKLPGRHVAAASGTAEAFSDAWTVGYTPSLAAAVWLGNSNYSLMPAGSDGIVVAAPAWHAFMQAALDQLGKGDEWYTAPAGVQSDTANGRQAWFLPGTSAATPAPALPPTVHQTA